MSVTDVTQHVRLNIASRLCESAELYPFQRAVVYPAGRDWLGRATYSQLTFRQLDEETDRLARGLREMGIEPGMRLVLAVPPSLEFIALTFALFKAGAVIVLIDPGMGRTNIFHCLEEVDPEGFVAIPVVHLIRILKRRRLPRARFNVTVGRSRIRTGKSYRELLGGEWTPFEMTDTAATDPAAIIFTSGSTGPPKGVLYEHGMFNAQVDLIREMYDIQPGEIDLPGFPLFALFNAAMGATTVVPDMNPTRPADVDAAKIVETINNQGVTQAFGSPAMWNNVGRYCEERAIEFPSLRRVLSAGAPVPIHVLQRMLKTLSNPAADIHTPYGATESLPVCSISGREVLERTAEQTRTGAGTCVGRRFPQISVRIVRITDEPIATLDEAELLPAGEIGEIIVRGPSATREYYLKPEATARAKIADGDSFWHRMGDVGYLDDEGHLWFCGRKSHIVETQSGQMFTEPCEAIFNEHPRVYRSALVGVGAKPEQRPVVIVEPEKGQFPAAQQARSTFVSELQQIAAAHPLTAEIETFLFHKSLPVDTRHNVKIRREQLAPWAEREIS